MSMIEASYIIKKSEDDYINKWNQTRYIVYSVIQSQSTTSLTPTDVLKFPWDEKPIEVNTPVKSKAELIAHALEMEKIINSNVRQNI
jgi:hypothetical protein